MREVLTRYIGRRTFPLILFGPAGRRAGCFISEQARFLPMQLLFTVTFRALLPGLLTDLCTGGERAREWIDQ